MICICICSKLSHRFLCGALLVEDVDKNKMDNHLPYKLELQNMPAIKEGKIKTAFAKGGTGREKEREREKGERASGRGRERKALSFIQLVRFLACLPARLSALPCPGSLS